MSESVKSGEIDLTALDQALNHDTQSNSQNENSQFQQQQQQKDKVEPYSLSTFKDDVKAAAAPSQPARVQPTSKFDYSAAPIPSSQQQQHSISSNVASDPATDALKAMFPEMDNDTISTVLSSCHGNQEAAVNALLHMSDPSYKSSIHDNQNTDSDALLAQTLAMEEEHRQRQNMLRYQQQQQQQQKNGRRGGGGAASFFNDFLSSEQTTSSSSSAPNYNPDNLTYQPRKKKSPLAFGERPPPPPPPAGFGPNDSMVAGMPGSNEAKQWQEGINRMAENGLAKAASTFSSIRQKASAAFSGSQPSQNMTAHAPYDSQPLYQGDSRPSGAESGGHGGSSMGGTGFWSGRGSSFQGLSDAFSGITTPKHQDPASPVGLSSPRSPQPGEYDRDPSPVGENELAKILARGGAAQWNQSPTSHGNGPNAASKARILADRYLPGSSVKAPTTVTTTTTNTTPSSTGVDYASTHLASVGSTTSFHGWEDAGRTPSATKESAVKDSVALMDSAQGRGLTSPKTTTPIKSFANPLGAAAAATTATTATALTAATANSAGDDGSDSDDLEYVSNPFEDED